MTNEFKKAFDAEMDRLGILCDTNNPTGVAVSQAENDSGQQMVGYVQIADDQTYSIVKETSAMKIATASQDSDDFWAAINAACLA
jgi:hypothetical protein